jgi:prolyl-tRNA synthetase
VQLEEYSYGPLEISVEIDNRDLRGGEKFWHYIKKGIPLVIEIGSRDVESDSVCFLRRDELNSGKQSCKRSAFVGTFCSLLDDIQTRLFSNALKYREEHTVTIDSEGEFFDFFKNSGGFVSAHWNGDCEVEERIKRELGVTIRCIPLVRGDGGVCPFSGKESQGRVIWARSY